MFEVAVKCVMKEPLTSRYLLILEAKDKSFYLPINIGVFEAEAIYTALNQIKSPRPLTYDFFKGVLKVIDDVDIEKITIYDVDGHIYKAKLEFAHNSKQCHVDCRPSDAIALGLRLNAPIFVEDSIVEQKKCVSKNCLQENEKLILEQLITDQATTYWNV